MKTQLVVLVIVPIVLAGERFDHGSYHDWGFGRFGEHVGDRRKCNKTRNENSLSPIQTRVTGGDLAVENMFPYQVGLVLLSSPNVFQCGGSLITVNYVLTAAHCLYGSMRGRVFLGSNEFANPSTAAAVIDVTSDDFIMHEKYAIGGGYDDIALIRLPHDAVTLSKAVQLIQLARKYMTQEFLEGETVTASGWGRISDSPTINQIPNVKLYYVDAPIMNQKECACFYNLGTVRSKNHICADGSNGKGTCDGDSGGPLIYLYRNITYLVGLTSFGSAGGCEIGFPSVYTRITTYLKWIAQRTGIEIR